MNKNKIISIGFILLVGVFTLTAGLFEYSTFAVGIFCFVMYVYYSFLIAPQNKKFQNIKLAVRNGDISNEELSIMTDIDAEKINLLRVNDEFTEDELERLAIALDVKEDRSAQRKGKRAILVVIALIITVCLVYFLFGEA